LRTLYWSIDIQFSGLYIENHGLKATESVATGSIEATIAALPRKRSRELRRRRAPVAHSRRTTMGHATRFSETIGKCR
jgi:hypothetical protein